jgi:hypothetical protein
MPNICTAIQHTDESEEEHEGQTSTPFTCMKLSSSSVPSSSDTQHTAHSINTTIQHAVLSHSTVMS